MPSGHKCMRKTPAESHRDMYMDCVMQKINPRSLISTIAVRLKGHLILQIILIIITKALVICKWSGSVISEKAQNIHFPVTRL